MDPSTTRRERTRRDQMVGFLNLLLRTYRNINTIYVEGTHLLTLMRETGVNLVSVWNWCVYLAGVGSHQEPPAVGHDGSHQVGVEVLNHVVIVS